jgi:hypothetical protein
MDMTGSHRIQRIGGQMIERMEGDFFPAWAFEGTGLVESWQEL